MTHARDAAAGRSAVAPAIAARLDRGAWLAFSLLVAIMPLRAHIDPLPHPATDLPAPLNDVVLYWIDGLVVATIGLWLVARRVDRRRILLPPRALLVPAMALVGLAWLTLPFGVAPDVSLFGAVRLTVLVGLALYVANEVDGLASLTLPLGLMVGVQAVVALAQFAMQGSVGLTALGELRLDPGAAGVAVIEQAGGLRVLRAYGLSTHPNVLGGFLVVGIVLLLGLRPAMRSGLLGQALVVALGAAGLLVTFSRGAWLGLGAGIVVGVAIFGARAILAERRRWLAAGGLALAVALIGGWQLRGELVVRAGLTTSPVATEQRSVDERLGQIELGWQVAMARPLSGAGMSAVPIAMERLDPTFAFAYYPPHVVPLVVLAELGFGGGVAILILLVAPWILLWRARPGWTGELAAASAALAALTVAGLFDDYPWVGGPGRTLFWVVLGLWVAVFIRRAQPDASTIRQ